MSRIYDEPPSRKAEQLEDARFDVEMDRLQDLASRGKASAPLGRQEAERMIARILQQLERSTGELVDCLQIVRLDLTTIEEARHQVSVCITLRRTPGHDWSTE